ncbi:MAG: glycosyltransferase [Muribaculaceae bacterium]|nr:glycosyltransferase [Muribaculaceae bacterium]
MKPHRVIHLNATANWGSTGKIAEGIGEVAMARGWESTIAYGRMMNPSTSNLIKTGDKADVYMHYARNRFLDGEGLGSRRATERLVREIENLSPDIIHLHNIHDHWLNYPVLFNYLQSVDTPVIWTFHDCWAFTGHCYHFEQAGCMKWRTHCGDCPKKYSFAPDRSARNFDLKKKWFASLGKRLTIVGASEWISVYAAESMLKGSNVITIHNGVNTDVFMPGGEKRRMILGVSNVWPPYKGLGDFCKLRKIIPADVEIVLVGLKDEQIKSLPEGITGMGRTRGVEELRDLYRQAAVFVNPTHNDTFPTVNIEALACGTPVVTYRTGGSPEAVDGDTGLVVEKGDVASLARAVMKVIDNPKDFSPENCRSRAVREFDMRRQFGRYVDLYDSLLNKS